MGKKDGKKWTAAVGLQPMYRKSDSLLGRCRRSPANESLPAEFARCMHSVASKLAFSKRQAGSDCYGSCSLWRLFCMG